MPSVADGDCLVSIADATGYRNYLTLWQAAENVELRQKRSNPNMLVPGDTVTVPAKVKLSQKATDNTWKFVVEPKKPVKLRIVVVGADNKPLGGCAWKLKSPIARSGTTGANGLIEIAELPPRAKAGVLEITLKKPEVKKAAAAPPPAAVSPAPYPPPIKADEFRDKQPPELKGGNVPVELTLKIGSLPPPDQGGGAQARLGNLGFGSDAAGDPAATTRAVKAYQKLHLKQDGGSGKLDDIRGDLQTRHDNL